LTLLAEEHALALSEPLRSASPLIWVAASDDV
jgi:hypothetical protein